MMIAYSPTTHLYQYTVFQSHVKKNFLAPQQGELEKAISEPDRMLLIPEHPPNHPKKTVIDILDEHPIYLISGSANLDKTACLLKGGRDSVDKNGVPYWVNRGDLGNSWVIDQIYATVADEVGVDRSEIRVLIRNSPPLLFFFDLSEVSRNLPRESAEELARFIERCRRNGTLQHQFVIAHEHRNDPIGEAFSRGEVTSPLIARHYSFQPELGYIAEKEPSGLEKAFEIASADGIKKFLSNLNLKERPSQTNKFRVISAMSQKLTHHRDPDVRRLVREKLTAVVASPDFNEGQRKAAKRGLET